MFTFYSSSSPKKADEKIEAAVANHQVCVFLLPKVPEITTFGDRNIDVRDKHLHCRPSLNLTSEILTETILLFSPIVCRAQDVRDARDAENRAIRSDQLAEVQKNTLSLQIFMIDRERPGRLEAIKTQTSYRIDTEKRVREELYLEKKQKKAAIRATKAEAKRLYEAKKAAAAAAAEEANRKQTEADEAKAAIPVFSDGKFKLRRGLTVCMCMCCVLWSHEKRESSRTLGSGKFGLTCGPPSFVSISYMPPNTTVSLANLTTYQTRTRTRMNGARKNRQKSRETKGRRTGGESSSKMGRAGREKKVGKDRGKAVSSSRQDSSKKRGGRQSGEVEEARAATISSRQDSSTKWGESRSGYVEARTPTVSLNRSFPGA